MNIKKHFKYADSCDTVAEIMQKEVSVSQQVLTSNMCTTRAYIKGEVHTKHEYSALQPNPMQLK